MTDQPNRGNDFNGKRISAPKPLLMCSGAIQIATQCRRWRTKPTRREGSGCGPRGGVMNRQRTPELLSQAARSPSPDPQSPAVLRRGAPVLQPRGLQ